MPNTTIVLSACEQVIGAPSNEHPEKQQAWANAWIKGDQLKVHRAVYAWVGRIYANCKISQGRRDARDRAIQSLSSNDGSENVTIACRNSRTASSLVLEQERRAVVNTAVDKLVELDQEVIHRRITLGMSFDAIAEKNGMNVATVRSRFHRALKKLRRDPAIRDLMD